MEIKRVGSQPSTKGPAEWFTGTVRIDPLFQAPEPARMMGVSVTFEPGARTAWHTHPLGQTLIITSGCGWVGRWGGPVEEVGPGDVVWFQPGEKHWHGASPTMAMTHIAVHEKRTASPSTGWNRSATSNTASSPAILRRQRRHFSHAQGFPCSGCQVPSAVPYGLATTTTYPSGSRIQHSQ